MQTVTLQFPSLPELLDFQLVTQTQTFHVNTVTLTLSGAFPDAEIELAKAGFGAHII